MENRELVTDIEEFLTKAAKFIRYMKEEFTKEDLKPGMLVEYWEELYIVLDNHSQLILYGRNSWISIGEVERME